LNKAQNTIYDHNPIAAHSELAEAVGVILKRFHEAFLHALIFELINTTSNVEL
jgi:hypothetical protein